jgi:hypothetical protein
MMNDGEERGPIFFFQCNASCKKKKRKSWIITSGNKEKYVTGIVNTETPPRAAASSLLLISYVEKNKA